MAADAAAEPAQSTLPKRAFAIIFCVSVATAIGNTGLISVLPAIGRSLGHSRRDGGGDLLAVGDPVGRLLAVLGHGVGPLWAQAADDGRASSGFMVSMTVCGVVVSAGLRHLAAPMVIFGLLLLGRALFGLFGAASNPATQAYVADHTPRERAHPGDGQPGRRLRPGHGGRAVPGALFIYPVVGLAGPLFTFAADRRGHAVRGLALPAGEHAADRGAAGRGRGRPRPAPRSRGPCGATRA